jgi:hypothetical protein
MSTTATNSRAPSKGHRFLINGERYDGKLDLEHWLVALSPEEKRGSVLLYAEENMKRAWTARDRGKPSCLPLLELPAALGVLLLARF